MDGGSRGLSGLLHIGVHAFSAGRLNWILLNVVHLCGSFVAQWLMGLWLWSKDRRFKSLCWQSGFSMGSLSEAPNPQSSQALSDLAFSDVSVIFDKSTWWIKRQECAGKMGWFWHFLLVCDGVSPHPLHYLHVGASPSPPIGIACLSCWPPDMTDIRVLIAGHKLSDRVMLLRCLESWRKMRGNY